jgi:carbon-monoxide dehydrogenase medium subunit
LHRPETAEEACELLARLGDDAVPYAGGTELLLLMKNGLARPGHLVDVKRIRGFAGVTDGPRLAIGATVTHRALERSATVRARCPLASAVARHVANVRVRNVGTVGGNLAFADPHSDLATLLLALDATVELVSPRGRREVPIADFVRGPWQTAREPDELLAAVHVTPWPDGTAGAYLKFGVHERPTLGVAVALRFDGDAVAGTGRERETPGVPRARLAPGTRVVEARIAVGCVDPRPARVPGAEARLAGVPAGALDDVIGDAAAMAEASADPADDLHGSADYKRAMVAVGVRRALRAAAARALGREPATRFPYTVVA